MWDYISETPEAIAAYAATHVAILAHVAIYLMYGLEIFLIWILTSCINKSCHVTLCCGYYGVCFIRDFRSGYTTKYGVEMSLFLMYSSVHI